MPQKEPTKIHSSLLPRGFRATVANKLKVSKSFVSAVAQGKKKSDKVLSCLLDIAEETKRAQQESQVRLTALND